MSKKTAVVICPGRGTYNKPELGYFHKYHADKLSLLKNIDSYRVDKNQLSLIDLDARKEFSSKEHTSGENAASLIYACSYADFLSINLAEFEIVAITGNSMGWYTACACAQVFNEKNAIHLINTMGSQMKEQIIGGQIIYPEVDEQWNFSSELSQMIDQKIKETNRLSGHEVYDSIFFGGYRIIGGNDAGLKKLLADLPKREERYPFKLMGNAAFHTPLLKEISDKALLQLPQDLFSSPHIPLIDGRGHIWMPHASSINELWDYTLGHQVYKTYDFSKSIEVAVKEFAPDHLILTGPGTTMGGAVAQTLINRNLKNIKNKEEFKSMQEIKPYLLSMGQPDQRELTLKT